jgi:hypothetical protein
MNRPLNVAAGCLGLLVSDLDSKTTILTKTLRDITQYLQANTVMLP